MSRLEDVLPAFRAGKEIRIKSWNKYVVFRNDQSSFDFNLEDMLSDDWEIVEDKPIAQKTKTVWQWRYLRDCGTWQVFLSLYTEKEAECEFLNYEYEKHLGPYEVSDE